MENSMEANTTLDILKQAILLETRGKAFYQKVAEHTKNKAIRLELFRQRSDMFLFFFCHHFKNIPYRLIFSVFCNFLVKSLASCFQQNRLF
jgi:hypothetical protein